MNLSNFETYFRTLYPLVSIRYNVVLSVVTSVIFYPDDSNFIIRKVVDHFKVLVLAFT
jgi:hypothetical protein